MSTSNSAISSVADARAANAPVGKMATWTRRLPQKELATRFGTPLFITSLKQLTANTLQWQQLTGDAGDIAWPVKANPSLAILQHLSERGCSADCASEHEVRLARLAGLPWSRLLYNSPVPSRELMVSILELGGTVVVDSVPLLQFLADRLEGRNAPGQVFLRVSPRLPVEYLHQTDWESSVAHASNSSKFGIPEESIVGLLQECRLPIHGLHLHVGTQMDHLRPFLSALELLHGLADEIHGSTSHEIQALDMGGGLGIGFQSAEQFPSISAYVEQIRGHLRPAYRYLVEPGHALLGNAVALLTEVREVKEIRGRRWALVDVGTDQLAKVTLMNWYHEILGPDGNPLPTTGPDALGGPHCFAGDLLLPETELGEIKRGDTLIVQHVGAYCYSLANHFNGRFGPAHVMLSEDDDDLWKVQESEDWFFHPGTIGLHPMSSFQQKPPEPPDTPMDLCDARVLNLSSAYLRETACEDRYELTEMRRLGNGIYTLEAPTSGKVDFVSMPLAIRIAGDAAIVASLDMLGRDSKDVSVWASHLAMTAKSIIRIGQPLRLLLRISPAMNIKPSETIRCLVHWEINEGEFKGVFRLSI